MQLGRRTPKRTKPFHWSEAILLIEEEHSTRQQAEDAEKRYVRQMGFPKYKLSTTGLRKFGPHKGTRKYILKPQALGKREGKVFVQRTPSQKYLRKAKAFDGTYRPWEVSSSTSMTPFKDTNSTATTLLARTSFVRSCISYPCASATFASGRG
jgi:hypothetical protein